LAAITAMMSAVVRSGFAEDEPWAGLEDGAPFDDADEVPAVAVALTGVAAKVVPASAWSTLVGAAGGVDGTGGV
jgi:hypothetical protein